MLTINKDKIFAIYWAYYQLCMCLHVVCKEYLLFFGDKCIGCLQKGANKLVVVAFWGELTGKPFEALPFVHILF